MTEHLKCPNYKDCPFYKDTSLVCNKYSGLFGNKTARCWVAYERYKLNQSGLKCKQN